MTSLIYSPGEAWVSTLHSPVSWAIFILLVVSGIYVTNYHSSSRHYPPGPKSDPLIGNLRQIPLEHQERTFSDWGTRYGDVVYARLLGKEMIILNTLQAARDLLEKRSAIYSDRPRSVLLEELMGWQDATTNMRYGPRFRKHRRFAQQTFNRGAVRSYQPLQRQEMGILLNSFASDPASFVQHFRRYGAATIMKITYGHDVKSYDDKFVQLAEKAGTATIEVGTPAATLVDFIPLLKHLPSWMPGGGFKREARKCQALVQAMIDIPFESVRDSVINGNAPPSFTSSILESYCKSGEIKLPIEDERDIKGAAGTLYAAAEDTTVSTLTTFILAMVLYPEVFKKAQREIDAVIGRQRLPTFEDAASLPYLDCLVKEVYRWHPPVPLGLPHRLMADDIYDGHHIPKGATVLANIWGMAKNCQSPDTFYPERYLEDPELPDPHSFVFGFGRRICPGRHFAHSSVWLVAANIIATMELSPAVDSDGKPTPVLPEFSSGFVSASEAQNQTTRLALPPPNSPSATTQVAVGSTAVKLDELGPMVVNSDGTLSRIANWGSMTEAEKERTLRVLLARNKVRLANEENVRKSNGGSPDEDDATLLSLSAPSTKKE
ncbi:hypothetical protein EYR38_010446 [Pleurotus pulmonarius]|nr:hypothetical protein EYR38_010446 [Pleurotus pulmonarius]